MQSIWTFEFLFAIADSYIECFSILLLRESIWIPHVWMWQLWSFVHTTTLCNLYGQFWLWCMIIRNMELALGRWHKDSSWTCLFLDGEEKGEGLLWGNPILRYIVGGYEHTIPNDILQVLPNIIRAKVSPR